MELGIENDELSLQKRVLSHCKQEMISSIVIGGFAAVIALGSFLYALSISEPEDALKLIGNILAIGFSAIAFLFGLRTVLRKFLSIASKDRNVLKLCFAIGFSILLDIFICLIFLAVILWSNVYKWLIILLLSIILDCWRFRTLILYIIECKNDTSYTIPTNN